MSEDKKNETAVAAKETAAVAAPAAMPEGFDVMAATEFAMPVIKVWHPMTKEEVEGGKLGQFYDVNTKKAIGGTLTFCLLAIRNMSFENDDGVRKSIKQLLVLPEGSDMPKILSFSVGSFRRIGQMMTAAMEKSQSMGGAPLYALSVKATLETAENDKGKFAVPNFEVDGEKSKERMDLAAELYARLGRDFGSVSAEELAE